MRALVTLTAVAASIALPSVASAAPPFVDRDITLPRHDWAFDVGLGVGFDTRTPSHSGPGFNLEMGVGITERVELGVRTGLRAGDDARGLGADEYGRLFDRESFRTGTSTVANPEVRVRGALARGGPVEVALEGRVALPSDTGRHPGLEFGVPLAFHAGRIVRIDTGAFVPVVFDETTQLDFHIPIFVWIQPTPRLWLGPLAGIRFAHRPGNNADRTDFSLGFGLGYALSRTIDLKTMFLFPRLNDNPGANAFGLGVGLQFRIE